MVPSIIHGQGKAISQVLFVFQYAQKQCPQNWDLKHQRWCLWHYHSCARAARRFASSLGRIQPGRGRHILSNRSSFCSCSCGVNMDAVDQHQMEEFDDRARSIVQELASCQVVCTEGIFRWPVYISSKHFSFWKPFRIFTINSGTLPMEVIHRSTMPMPCRCFIHSAFISSFVICGLLFHPVEHYFLRCLLLVNPEKPCVAPTLRHWSADARSIYIMQANWIYPDQMRRNCKPLKFQLFIHHQQYRTLERQSLTFQRRKSAYLLWGWKW